MGCPVFRRKIARAGCHGAAAASRSIRWRRRTVRGRATERRPRRRPQHAPKGGGNQLASSTKVLFNHVLPLVTSLGTRAFSTELVCRLAMMHGCAPRYVISRPAYVECPIAHDGGDSSVRACALKQEQLICPKLPCARLQ